MACHMHEELSSWAQTLGSRSMEGFVVKTLFYTCSYQILRTYLYTVVGSFVLPKPTLAFGASKEVINNPTGHHLLTYLDHILLIWRVTFQHGCQEGHPEAVGFFVGAKFHQIFNLKNMNLTYKKDFSWKQWPKLARFLFLKSKSSNLYDKFQQVVKNIEGFQLILLSYLVCSQIWLNHVMDNCHFNCITKLKKKTFAQWMYHASQQETFEKCLNLFFYLSLFSHLGKGSQFKLTSSSCACPSICHPSSCFSSFFLVFAIVVYRSFLIVLIILFDAPLVPCCLKNKQFIV